MMVVLALAVRSDTSGLFVAFGRSGGSCASKTTTTPLTLACYQGDVNAISALLQQGAGVDQEDDDGYTPLFVASLKGHVDAALLLLDAGAAVDKRREGDWSPFGGYVRPWICVDLATLLVDRGANATTSNTCIGGGATATVRLPEPEPRRDEPMSRARRRCELGQQRGEYGSVWLPERPRRRRDCCWRKARRSTGRIMDGQEGQTPLYIACEKNHVDAARLVLDKGAVDINRAKESERRRRCLSPARRATSTRRDCCWRKAQDVDRADKDGQKAAGHRAEEDHDAIAALLDEHLDSEVPTSRCGTDRRRRGD